MQPITGQAIDHETAHAADALSAVMVESDRVLSLFDEPLVEHVEHLQERHVLAGLVHLVADHAALVLRVLLPPDMKDQSHHL